MKDRVFRTSRRTFFTCCLAIALNGFQPSAKAEAPAAGKLAADLRCPACHSGLGIQAPGPTSAPDLSFAGRQFNPAYLFEYLLRPHAVRKSTGGSRMPDFGFSPEESLALTLFLAAQQEVPAGWPQAPSASEPPSRGHQPDAGETDLFDRSGCHQCHRHRGRGGDQALDLDHVGVRLNRPWVASYLVDPSRLVPGIAMYAPFYRFDTTADRYVELIPGSAASLDAVVRGLFGPAAERRGTLGEAYRDAQRRFPHADAGLGERIYRSQNCAACHRLRNRVAKAGAAPDLSVEGSRVRRQWLESYLRHPTAVRPSGYPPGSGSRMPDFHLSEREAALLTELLMDKVRTPEPRPPVAPLSRFAMGKAGRLLREKLPCLGCHRLGDEGGRIGPDLSSLKDRLRPSYVVDIIREPKNWIPGAAMPRARLTAPKLDLVARFLLQQDLPAGAPAYLPLGDVLPGDTQSVAGTPDRGERLYHRYCSHCHGGSGEGDGFNAAFLPTAPTDLKDGAALSHRPDDTLFDGIAAGGAILGKSPRMPAWGHSLSHDDMRALVDYLRRLCECRGPPWSRDDHETDP